MRGKVSQVDVTWHAGGGECYVGFNYTLSGASGSNGFLSTIDQAIAILTALRHGGEVEYDPGENRLYLGISCAPPAP